MGREFELKYRATEEALLAIREKFGGFSPIRMETAYYDTPSRALSARRWMLRRRLENGASVCTLKTPLPDGSRGEWETGCGEITPAIEMLCKLGAPKELPLMTKEGLEQVCAARFTRLAKTIVLEQATVELALDQGVLLGGGREEAFREVEVELKSGSEAEAMDFAASLAEEFSLTPEHRGKVQRAMALLG